MGTIFLNSQVPRCQPKANLASKRFGGEYSEVPYVNTSCVTFMSLVSGGCPYVSLGLSPSWYLMFHPQEPLLFPESTVLFPTCALPLTPSASDTVDVAYTLVDQPKYRAAAQTWGSQQKGQCFEHWCLEHWCFWIWGSCVTCSKQVLFFLNSYVFIQVLLSLRFVDDAIRISFWSLFHFLLLILLKGWIET